MFQDALMQYLPVVTHAVVRGLVIFVLALAVVYLLGRMLELIKSNRSKNTVAFLIMVMASYWSVFIYDVDLVVSVQEIYWRGLIYVAIAVVFYVLLGFDLFDRFNSWCDRKFGDNDIKKKK